MNYYDPKDVMPANEEPEENISRQYIQMTYEERLDLKTLLNHLHIEDVFYARHILKGIIFKKGHLKKSRSTYNPLDSLFKDGGNNNERY